MFSPKHDAEKQGEGEFVSTDYLPPIGTTSV